MNWSASSSAFGSILEAIGRTPMVKLQKIPKEDGISAVIYVKLDFLNPSGSLKDRIYYRMITGALKRGDLKPGMEVVEVSTGNAGISCTFVARRMGFEVTIVMPSGMSEERKKLIKALGGRIIETPGGESDVDLSYEYVRNMVKSEPGRYWLPDQFSNAENKMAHYETTGPEIWEQTAGKVDGLVLTQGSGGSLTGAGQYLREKKTDVKLYAAEPAEAPLLSRRLWGSHSIEGIGDGFVPKNLELRLLNGVVLVKSEEAIEMAQRLMLEEGLLVGISSGANLVAAMKVSRKHPDLQHIVTMMNDTATRYFSTSLFGVRKELRIPEREHRMDEYTQKELDKYQARWEIID